jgi:hypothetical protein
MWKYIRICGAVLLTALMLYVARKNSVGSSEHFTGADGQYQFEITTVPKVMENSDTTVWVDVVGPFSKGQQVVLLMLGNSKDSSNQLMATIPFTLKELGSTSYYIRIPLGKRNDRLYYRIGVTDQAGTSLGVFSRPDGSPFMLRSIGHVPAAVLIGHIVFIFATFFCVALAALYAIPLIAGGTEVRPLALWYRWAAICTFIGGYPLGFAMNWFAFGGIWEGVPFGTDATDNKTQLLFVYLVFMALATIGISKRFTPSQGIFSPRTLGLLGLCGFFLQLAIYLIPHSIQFSAGLTYGVCYGFIALVAGIYAIGLIRSRGATTASPNP